MAWYDFLERDTYQRWFERDRFEKDTEPPREKESWLTKAYETFRKGAEVAKRAMVEPEIPMPAERAFEPERPLMEQLPSPAYTEAGPRTRLALIYRDIQRRIERGEITAERAQFEWDTASETAFGNVQALGLGERRPHRKPTGVMGQVGEFITPLAPAEAFKFMEKVPVAGEFMEKAAQGIMTPAGLLGTAVWPGITAGMVAGGVTGGVAGKGIEAAGVPVAEVGPMRVGPSGVLETIGTLAGPVAGPAAARAGVRGVKAAPAAARTARAEVERLIPPARRVLGEELGGPRMRPEFRVTLRDTIKMQGRKVAEPFEREFTVQATTEQQAIKSVTDLHPKMEFVRVERVGAKPPTPTAGARALRIPTRDVVVVRDTKGALLREIDINIGNIELRVAGTPQEVIMDMARAAGKEPTVATGRKLVRFVDDFRSMNPETAIVAEGMTPRLAKIYERFGFEPTGQVSPGNIPVLRLRPLKTEIGVAPKPAAQAFREATEPRALEEAFELGGMGGVEALEAPGLARAGVRAPGRAGAPPPPRKPPVAEAVPPIGAEDPVPKLIQLIKKAKPVRAETERLKTTARRKQAAAMGKIFEKYPGEAPYRAKGVLRGELPSAAFEPPINALSEAEVGQLRRQIRSFFEREGGRAFDELSVRDALEGILGGKQPTWGEIGQLQAVFGRKLGAALEGKMPPLKRVAREALEIWNLGRTFKASLDQSWHLRQGIRLGARHPRESVREGLRGMKALWSQQTYEDSVRFIVRGQETGEMSPNLFAGRVGPGATTVERTEAYISRWSDVIPFIKHTAREYAASGNFVRGAINRNMNRTWTQRLGRKLTEQEMEWTGRVCNWGLGRGPLPDEFRGLLAAIWFAPGYRTAGPAYFSLLVNPKTPGFVRRMVAEEVVAWVGSGVALLTALELSGVADVEGIDLRHPGRVSSDFGKIRVGKMRFDIWGGSQQQARAILGLITGERKTLSTGEIMDINRREVASRYIESGYQPSMGLATSIWTGKDWEGKPITLPAAVQDLLAPMAGEDILEAVREEGAKGWIAAPFAHLGVGVWTPDLAGVRVNELTQRYDAEGRHKNEMSAVEFDRLAEEYPDLAKARQDQLDESALRGSDWAKFTLKREDGDAEFEKGLKDALLDPRGRTWEQMGRELDDHVYEWAIRSDEFYGELDIDPRGDLDRRVNAYYAIEMPALATEEERSAFFRQREEMLRDDPDLAAAIHDHKVLRFTDPDVRRFVDLKWQAGLVANEYYSIPYKARMPAEQQEQVQQYVKQAEAIARMQNVSFRRALMQTSIPQELIGLAMRYKRLPTNKARERYWRQHPESEELYRTFYGPIPLEIPLEVEPEMAMAEVP